VELSDQFCGCVLGLAVGDALGGPALRQTPAQLRVEHGVLRDMAGGGRRQLRPGETTDATALMLCALDSYNVRGAFDPHDIAECFAATARSPHLALGPSTAAACRFLAEGYAFERAAQLAYARVGPAQRLSGDCLPRVVPTGLLHYHDDLHLIGETRVVCSITHLAELCRMSCVALNLALQHMLLVGTGGLLEELIVYVEPRSAELAQWLKRVPNLRPERLDATGHVAAVLQAALWAALYCTSLEEGLVLVVNCGGEAPLLGSVAGALLGARFGVEAVPARWRERLEGWDTLDRAAGRMFALSQRDSLPEPPGEAQTGTRQPGERAG
jgi:ADP-ribosyl-[dinitrogen reductase] hydrolase